MAASSAPPRNQIGCDMVGIVECARPQPMREQGAGGALTVDASAGDAPPPTLALQTLPEIVHLHEAPPFCSQSDVSSVPYSTNQHAFAMNRLTCQAAVYRIACPASSRPCLRRVRE